MSTRLSRLFGSTPAQRRVRYGVLVAAVIAVPLAVSGLVSGALGGAGDNLEQIPAVVVNNDEMVTMTLPDGTDQPVLAGRQLVTELTDPDTAGFQWKISNDEEAAGLLASGDAYAVLTIPEDFSESVTSLSGRSPQQANLDIRTDDAHGYLAGSVAQSVGDAMSATFGRELTAQYLEGFYTNLATMGGALGEAAGGATQLSTGVGSLAGGLGTLSNGVAGAASGATDAASGAHAYAAGVTQYTHGVDGIASGLAGLDQGAAGLDGLSVGWDQYVGMIAGASGELTNSVDALNGYVEQNPGLLEQFPELAEYLGYVGQVEQGVSQFAAGGTKLAAETRGGIDGIQAGISQLSGGAAQVAAGSGGIRDGANGLASGLDELAGGLGALQGGASDAAAGATQLAGGANTLASGLASGAESAKALTDIDGAATAEVVAEPVTVQATRDHEIAGTGEVIGMLFLPIGLWLGAMALFLVFRPFGREALRSTASTGGLVWRTLARAGLLALAQAVAVVLLLHGAMGVAWTLLPQTLAFAALLALVFTALHAFLTVWLGRAGLLVSLVLVALQLTASGGLYPIEVLSGPFQAISPFLPLTWAVQGMQLIVAGASGGAVALAAGALAVFGLAGVLGTGLVIGRRRGVRSIGFAAAALG
ncbi:YhgE/Pip domain-containing protein [Agromyces badenianii]|uniref:YhgE/Pip domain-containing protein n=1 Tax=Agromyces badenianii TaxID=2080742 RepID=A0A2S0WWZ7_9MICO|nr:YhgE/Pip family protein [Agromyces badenianii]AWB95831.1 YhgE/Pip domain-containing protein [Agromyces badenianii]